MENFKFRILEIKKNTDVTCITAECMTDGEVVTLGIATVLSNDRSIIKAELMRKYLAQTTCDLKVGEII